MSVALGLGLGFSVLTSVAGVLGVGLVVGYQNTVDLLRQKAELIIGSQREQVLRFLEAAENQVNFISDQVVKAEIQPGPSDDFISLLLGALSATPQIIRIQFIGGNDRLIGVERQQGESVPIFQRMGDDDDLRRLVAKAVKASKPYWGDLLWRAEYGQPVLNYQRPIVRDGETLGVLSAWISIRQLSEFLSNLQLDLGVNAFILHGQDQVLAHPLMAFGYPDLNRTAPLPRQLAYADPVVSSMWSGNTGPSIVDWFLSGPGVERVGLGEQEYIILYDEMTGYSDRSWLIATYFESHDMAEEAKRLRWAIIFCLVMAVVSASVAAYIGHQIARPVRRLADGAKKVHGLDLGSVERIPRSFFRELDDAAQSFNLMLDGLRWFERYVPKGLVQRLMRLNPDMEGETSFREVAIMFADLVGFTTLSENLTAPEAAAFLNDHFAMVAACVEAEAGTVDKFIGDSVMALWGVPERQSNLADRACRCALAISRAVQQHNARLQVRQGGAARVRLRIGIHIGRVVAGNIGSSGRVNYTVIGDAVNIAQRLEEAAKIFGDPNRDVNILVSEAIRSGLVETYVLSELGPQTLRGREEPVETYLLEGEGA